MEKENCRKLDFWNVYGNQKPTKKHLGKIMKCKATVFLMITDINIYLLFSFFSVYTLP